MTMFCRIFWFLLCAYAANSALSGVSTHEQEGQAQAPKPGQARRRREQARRRRRRAPPGAGGGASMNVVAKKLAGITRMLKNMQKRVKRLEDLHVEEMKPKPVVDPTVAPDITRLDETATVTMTPLPTFQPVTATFAPVTTVEPIITRPDETATLTWTTTPLPTFQPVTATVVAETTAAPDSSGCSWQEIPNRFPDYSARRRLSAGNVYTKFTTLAKAKEKCAEIGCECKSISCHAECYTKGDDGSCEKRDRLICIVRTTAELSTKEYDPIDQYVVHVPSEDCTCKDKTLKPYASRKACEQRRRRRNKDDGKDWSNMLGEDCDLKWSEGSDDDDDEDGECVAATAADGTKYAWCSEDE